MAMRAATDEMKAVLIQMAMKRVVMRLVSCKEGLPNPGRAPRAVEEKGRNLGARALRSSKSRRNVDLESLEDCRTPMTRG